MSWPAYCMSKLNFLLLKVVRWSGWPMLPLILLFLLTGYIMDGRYGLSRLLDEKSALTLHRMLHVPLIALVLAHSLAAAYLAIQRWGWIKRRAEL
jgi:cytochrome b subunit of formate dehydrogenase